MAGGRPARVKTALVTGAAGGIGYATVTRLRGDGWTVLATDLKAPDDAGSDDWFVAADLAATDGLERIVATTRAKFDRLDLLVNNAALQVCEPVDKLTTADWDRTMAVNARAPFVLCRDLLPMLAAARGAIVNVSSVHAVATSAGMAAYAASKGALSALTRVLALECAASGVRVNAVLPGATDTPMLRAGFEERAANPQDAARRKNALVSSTPLQRIGTASEIAAAIAFLADGKQSGFMTGATLTVDGGVLAGLKSE